MLQEPLVTIWNVTIATSAAPLCVCSVTLGLVLAPHHVVNAGATPLESSVTAKKVAQALPSVAPADGARYRSPVRRIHGCGGTGRARGVMRQGRRAVVAGEPESAPQLRVANAMPESASSAEAALEVTGHLAAELAHDLSNELTAALNYSYLLARALKHEPVLKAHVEELQAAAWRAARLTQSLKLFPPRRAQHREALDVNEVITATMPVLRRLLTEHTLEISLALPSGSPLGTRTALERILVGLVLHARDALPNGSAVVLTTEWFHADARTMVRLSCRGRRPAIPVRDDTSRVAPRGQAPRWALFRRAARHLGARLSHDGDAVHVDLPV